MGNLTQKLRTRKLLKSMEPMSGLEPLTYALRMGVIRMMKMIDKALVSYLATDRGAFSTSIDGLFVSYNPIRPDLYSQKN